MDDPSRRDRAAGGPVQAVPEFTIDIETVAGADLADEAVDALDAALRADGRALGAGVYVDALRERLAARYQLEAPGTNDAWRVAVDVFERALRLAGQPVARAGALAVV